MALSIALTGLSTIFSNRVCNTSPIPCGALWAMPSDCSASVVGNSVLAITASRAAAMVPARYMMTMGRICAVWLALRLAIAEATSTSTSTGATALSAETKKLPSSIADLAAFGETSARPMPSATPTAICTTRLPERIRLIMVLALIAWILVAR